MKQVQSAFQTLTGIDPAEGAAAARQAKFAQQLASLQQAAALKEQAETTGALASIRNRPARGAFLSAAGYSGLRRSLGGPQSA